MKEISSSSPGLLSLAGSPGSTLALASALQESPVCHLLPSTAQQTCCGLFILLLPTFSMPLCVIFSLQACKDDFWSFRFSIRLLCLLFCVMEQTHRFTVSPFIILLFHLFLDYFTALVCLKLTYQGPVKFVCSGGAHHFLCSFPLLYHIIRGCNV